MNSPIQTRSRRPLSQASLTSQNWPIEQLPGLSEKEQAVLQQVGIATTFDLLRRTQALAQLRALANQIKHPPKYVQKWAALADLARVPGVDCRYCGLLLHAGIGSAAQLAQASAHRLHPQLLRLHVKVLRRRDLAPTAGQVSQWIRAAQRLSKS